MGEILDIEKLQEMAYQDIQIPGFNNDTITVRVQRPRLLDMAAKGKIPNPLMAEAAKLVREGIDLSKADIKETANTVELYCMACLVKPTYDEFKDIMTDDQKFFIFLYGTGQLNKLRSFRDKEEDDRNNRDGKILPGQAERDSTPEK